jgi:hypothetical protein
MGKGMKTAYLNTTIFLTIVFSLSFLFFFTSKSHSVSEAEKRALAPFPDIDGGKVFSGEVSKGIEAFVCDHFPLRDAFLAMHFFVKERKGVRNHDFAFYENITAENDGLRDVLPASLPDKSPEAQLEDEDEDRTLAEMDEGLGGALVASRGGVPAFAVKKGILIVGGRAMEAFGGSSKGSRMFAQVVNTYREVLPRNVTVFALIVPSASAFYLPEEYKKRSNPQAPFIEATYALLRSDVKAIRVLGEMETHKNEDLYLKTDHHWTGIGAYYAYRAFCKVASIEPIAMERLKRAEVKPYLGSLYYLVRDESLKNSDDSLVFFVLPWDFDVQIYKQSSSEGNPVTGKVIYENAKNYGVFLGGDAPMIVISGGEKNGRRALLVKNSHGNAFATFLPPHFEEVVVIDYRYFKGTVVDLVKRFNITDVIVLHGVFSANTLSHLKMTRKILDGQGLGTRHGKERK